MPVPSPDSAQILPPYRCTMRWQMARPTPVPGTAEPWSRLKTWKIFSRYSGAMGTADVEIGSPEEADDVETAGDGSERRLFVRRLDFEVWHSRDPVR